MPLFFHKFRTALVLGALALVCSGFADSKPSVRELRDIANKMVRENQTPGVVALVVQKGKVIAEARAGVADLEHRVPMQRNSVHELASVSKQFTAVAVLKLIDQGKLKLDAKLADFVSKAPEPWSKITVEQLLQHTSGLPDYLGRSPNLTESSTTDQLLARIASLPLDSEPGTKWEYSNSGYMALGHIISRTSGKSFAAFIQDELLTPAGMKTARIANPLAIIPNRAEGYSRFGTAWVREQFVSPALSALGDGMVMASAEDLIAWHRYLVAGAGLSSTLRAKAWTRNTLPKAPSYGFGWGIERAGTRPRISHNGGWVGTSTMMVSDLEHDIALILLCNADAVDFSPLESAMRKFLP
mgnify:FL=1